MTIQYSTTPTGIPESRVLQALTIASCFGGHTTSQDGETTTVIINHTIYVKRGTQTVCKIQLVEAEPIKLICRTLGFSSKWY